ncbi:hypothetical protein BVC71_06700 [Marivivens niveibacter]|uniref:Uncharacterized protein n=2 Tax=Marivivens niveibacter TaxID=1930667 RepID=A0A251WZP1_9RHOB|nr:hypothetical protein BVC71_06700 [Marivivens niveibacter]
MPLVCALTEFEQNAQDIADFMQDLLPDFPIIVVAADPDWIAHNTFKFVRFIRDQQTHLNAAKLIMIGRERAANSLITVLNSEPSLFSDLILLNPLDWKPAPANLNLTGKRILITWNTPLKTEDEHRLQAYADSFRALSARVFWNVSEFSGDPAFEAQAMRTFIA